MGLQDYNIEDTKKTTGMWPVYGLVMAIALGGVSYVLGPRLYDFVLQRTPNFSIGDLSQDRVELMFAGAIFLVLLSIVSLVVAIAAPRKKSAVQDADLVKERKMAEVERRARKKRQLKLDRKAREEYRRLE